MSKPLICVTVTAPTTAVLRQRRDAVANADLVELRLDSVSDPDVAGALAGRVRPVIVTCRPVWEGGHFRGAEDDRRRMLADALALGAEYVDIEWRAHFDSLISPSTGRRIVLSSHDFDGVPADLRDRVTAMASMGAGVVKIAVATHSLSDCVPLLELASLVGDRAALVVIGMGDFGTATRVLAGRFGCAWTYAGSERQIGQIATSTLVDDYRFRTIGESTDVYGVVGLPVSHSVSPAMHNAAFASTGLDAVYLPLPAVSADDVMTFGRAVGVKGLSVTIPHKIALVDRMDDVDPVGRSIGAINTIRVTGGRWSGRNTDVDGFLSPLTARMPLAGVRAAILGSGGAARAAAAGLASRGCRVRVHGRNQAQVAAVASLTSVETGSYPPERGSWDLLVNCTPLGTYPHVEETPIAADDLTGRFVYDLVYNPAETRLLRDAARAGCETIGGLDMLVAQAREQFRWWTGIEPSVSVMREAASARLAEFTHDGHHVV